MRLLAEEWRQREKQRDHVIQTKVAAYHKLQEQLQQSLDHVIQQRQHLEAWQQEVGVSGLCMFIGCIPVTIVTKTGEIPSGGAT